MLISDFEHIKIILASGSPRRKELLAMLGFDFEVRVKEVEEDYPEILDAEQIPEYLAKKKAEAFGIIAEDELIITADTLVLCDGEVLGKPADEKNAHDMLRKLSGKKHQVITGVQFSSSRQNYSFSDRTDVFFAGLSDEEITYYIRNYKPFDKAGAYGIQDWIGARAVQRIEGSYSNVMGLPTEKLYAELGFFLRKHKMP